MKKTLPLFIINGFLDSGKTTFITQTLLNDGFYEQTHKRSLLVVCEEGETEYNIAQLNKLKIDVIKVDTIDDLKNADFWKKNLAKTNPGRVVMEMNGMWDDKDINWSNFNLDCAQYITVIDYMTFPVYLQNMRQLIMDKVKESAIVLFNRANSSDQLAQYSTSMKMANPNAIYYLQKADGNVVDAFEMPLPYDINHEPIEISMNDFGRWYIDTFDNYERYDNKDLCVTAQAFMDPSLPPHSFVLGRMAMTCCSNDIQLYGHLCYYDPTQVIDDKDWVKVTAHMLKEWNEEYQEDEPVLRAIHIEKVAGLENPILDLTK